VSRSLVWPVRYTCTLYIVYIFILGVYSSVYRNCRRGSHSQACEYRDIDLNADLDARDDVETKVELVEESSNQQSTTKKGKALRSNVLQPEKYSK
jgi:hypothetical protein